MSNGDQLTVDKRSAAFSRTRSAPRIILVDGLGGRRCRQHRAAGQETLSESGLIIVVAAIDRARKIVSRPDIVSRGFVYVRENEDLIKDAREVALQALEDSLCAGSQGLNAIKNSVREEMRRFIFRRTKRDPIILPIFLDV